MKKTILFMLAIVCVAGNAFAAYQAIENGASIGSTVTTTIKGSKGVQADYAGDSASTGQGYTLGAYHGSGTQTYGTSSGDTKIYKQDATAVAPPSTVPTGSNTANFTGWTAM